MENNEANKARYDPGLLERAILAISPSWAYQRAAWKNAYRSAYDSGSFSRPNSNWVAHGGTAEQQDRGQRDLIRYRARDLERNNDIFEGLITPYTRNVIGTGLRLQAKVKENGIEQEELNQQIEDLFAEWCEAANCDVTEKQTFSEMQEMAVRRLRVDGGIIFIKASTNYGILPFQLQVLEVDDLATDLSQMAIPAPGNRIIAGVELNRHRRPVAYYFRDRDPEGYYTGKCIRVPADRVIFPWERRRPSQIREVSPMVNTMDRIKNTDEYMEAVTIKERVLACFGLAVKRLNPPPGNQMGPGRFSQKNDVDQQSGYKGETITPGMIMYLAPGEEAQTIAPNGAGSQPKDFISIQQRLSGAGQGLSYEAASRDMSQVNYSSARQGLLEDRGSYKRLQQFIINHLCKEVYREFIKSAILSGKLPISLREYAEDPRKYTAHRWITPGWDWIDPLKEAKADESALNNNLNTLENMLASRGLDYKEVLLQRRKEKELMQEYGLGGVTVDKNAKPEPSGKE